MDDGSGLTFLCCDWGIKDGLGFSFKNLETWR